MISQGNYPRTAIACDAKHCTRGTSRRGLIDIRTIAEYIGWTRDGDKDMCPRCSLSDQPKPSTPEATPQEGE